MLNFKLGLKQTPGVWNEGTYLSFLSTGQLASAAQSAIRLPIRNVKVVGGYSLAVVVIWTLSVSEAEPADLVLVYHGGGATSFGKANKSLRHNGFKALGDDDSVRTNDIHVNQIPQQIAAANLPVVAMIPQGPHRESFGRSQAKSLWTLLKNSGYFDADVGNLYVAGHSAGGPIAVRAAHDPDIKGLFLFDPVIQKELRYVKRLADRRVGDGFQVFAAFNTATTGSYTRYKGAGEKLQEHAAGRYTVVLKTEACGPHAHHSMMSSGSESQDKQVGDGAGYTRDYVPGSGNFEQALRQVLSNLVT